MLAVRVLHTRTIERRGGGVDGKEISSIGVCAGFQLPQQPHESLPVETRRPVFVCVSLPISDHTAHISRGSRMKFRLSCGKDCAVTSKLHETTPCTNCKMYPHMFEIKDFQRCLGCKYLEVVYE